MTLDSAKRMLLDVASYAYFRKDETPPFKDEEVKAAIELVWADTFGTPMDFVDRTGMYMETEEDRRKMKEITG